MSRIFPRSISRERVLNQAEGRMSEKHKSVLLVSCITVRPKYKVKVMKGPQAGGSEDQLEVYAKNGL